MDHLVRHMLTKFFASSENFSGIWGTGSPDPMAKMAAIGGMSAQGGLRVAISNTVQPMDLDMQKI